MDPILGMTIGNYQVQQKLGEGGMGSVYLAVHPHIGKKVALKVLHAEFASNTDVVTRFFNEAKAVNDIGHPNIVDVLDYGVLSAGPTGDQLVYFIMEFLPGATLSQLLHREGKPLSAERALGITLQVADALSASHKSNIVHRDLKPDNIILIQRGRDHDFVKLLDFGIAKLTGDQPGSRRTRTGLVMGTPAYMSPEQCEGRGNVDHRADVYALGIVLYEMVTGRVPFHGEGYGEVLVQHLTRPPERPTAIRPEIPPHVEAIILKALEKRPEMRYPTMDEMSKAMADPVGYVESHGGLAQFLQTPLQATNEPIPPVSRLTPSPLSRLTPVPGSIGTASTPTTLGGSAGQVAGDGSKKKVGLFVGIGVVAVAAAVMVVVLSGGGGGGSTPAAGSGSGSVREPGSGSDPGSAVVEPGSGSNPGSAVETGSGSGSDVGSAGSGSQVGSAGSGSQVGSGSGSDVGSGSGADVGSGSGSAVGGKISIHVESVPSGAFVTFGTELSPRGKTPITFEVDRSDGEADIEISLSGHIDESRTVKLNGKVDLEVALKKKSRSGGSSSRGSGSGSSGGSSTDTGGGTGRGDDVMDPFANKKPKPAT